MTDTTHCIQIAGPFGSYVHEDHGATRAYGEPKKGQKTGLAIALTVTLFIAVTAAAMSASSGGDETMPNLRQQAAPSLLMKLPSYYGHDDALF